MPLFHRHIWELTDIDCCDLGTKKLFRRCKKCGKLNTEILYPAHDLSWGDIPKISKRKCMNKHTWKFIKKFYYIFDIGMGEIKCKVNVYSCTRCGKLECKDVSSELEKITENYIWSNIPIYENTQNYL